MSMMNEEQTRAYYDGLAAGINRYARMRDGIYYVGTTGKTLRGADTE